MTNKSEEKNNLICPECKSIEIYYENPKTGNGLYNCEECGFAGNENIFIMTNGDKIRHMSDEELAEFIDKIINQERDDWSPIGCYNCISHNTHHQNERECGNCKWFGGLKNWLESECES